MGLGPELSYSFWSIILPYSHGVMGLTQWHYPSVVYVLSQPILSSAQGFRFFKRNDSGGMPPVSRVAKLFLFFISPVCRSIQGTALYVLKEYFIFLNILSHMGHSGFVNIPMRPDFLCQSRQRQTSDIFLIFSETLNGPHVPASSSARWFVSYTFFICWCDYQTIIISSVNRQCEQRLGQVIVGSKISLPNWTTDTTSYDITSS